MGESLPNARRLLVVARPALQARIRIVAVAQGWHVDVAASAQEGRSRLDEGGYPLLVVDARLPEVEPLLGAAGAHRIVLLGGTQDGALAKRHQSALIAEPAQLDTQLAAMLAELAQVGAAPQTVGGRRPLPVVQPPVHAGEPATAKAKAPRPPRRRAPPRPPEPGFELKRWQRVAMAFAVVVVVPWAASRVVGGLYAEPKQAIRVEFASELLEGPVEQRDLLDKGVLHFRAGEHDLAHGTFTRAHMVDPKSDLGVYALVMRAKNHAVAGRLHRADKDLVLALASSEDVDVSVGDLANEAKRELDPSMGNRRKPARR